MLEAGQSIGLINEILPVSKLFENLISEFRVAYNKIISQKIDNNNSF